MFKILKNPEFWKIAIPGLIAITSLYFNFYQFNVGRKDKEVSAKISAARDSTEAKLKELELRQKYPSFEVAYYDMDVFTYKMFVSGAPEVLKKNKLVESHPLRCSRFLKNDVLGVDEDIPQEDVSIMVIMVKQGGGSKASDVEFVTGQYTARKQDGFSYCSDITGMFGSRQKTVTVFRLGEMNPGESVIIPLFLFRHKSPDDFNYYTLLRKVYIPDCLKFKGIDGTQFDTEVRKMLDVPFSITVNISGRG
ncbi:MAG: hypothetical protein LWX56_15330 [Ignavibacteria bacterium]|nr:hypothetical protein [Ignavibacteria bacterium]